MNPTQMMQKVAEVAPEKFTFFKLATAEIGKGPFAAEVREELDGIMKKAMASWGRIGGALGGAAKATGKYLGGVGAAAGTAALGGIAVALASDAYGAAKRGLTKSRNYQAMLESNPDLREIPADRVQRAFSTLHRMNPTFSGDPTVAGSFVRRQTMTDLPEYNPNELKTLIDAHKNLQDADQLPNFDPRMPHNLAMQPFQMDKIKHDLAAGQSMFKHEKGMMPMNAEKLYHEVLKARRGKQIDDEDDMLAQLDPTYQRRK